MQPPMHGCLVSVWVVGPHRARWISPSYAVYYIAAGRGGLLRGHGARGLRAAPISLSLSLEMTVNSFA